MQNEDVGIYVRSCRRTGAPISQVVLGKPMGFHTNDDTYCSFNIPQQGHVTAESHAIMLKARMDNKYDGQQRRYMSLSLTRNTVDERGRGSVHRETIHRVPVSGSIVPSWESTHK